MPQHERPLYATILVSITVGLCALFALGVIWFQGPAALALRVVEAQGLGVQPALHASVAAVQRRGEHAQVEQLRQLLVGLQAHHRAQRQPAAGRHGALGALGGHAVGVAPAHHLVVEAVVVALLEAQCAQVAAVVGFMSAIE